MSAALSKCDLLRAGAAATMSASACTTTPPAADCAIMELLNKKDMFTQTKYSPSGLSSELSRKIRLKEMSILEMDINKLTAQIKSKYGDSAPVDITWNDLTECLLNPGGGPGGTYNNTYYQREDLVTLGYQPQPILGAGALANVIPPSVTGKVPVWLDHVVNPDLAVILIFAILVIVFAVLMYKASRSSRRLSSSLASKKNIRLNKKEADDPYRGSAFESYPTDPNARWKSLIPVYEAQGYNMCAYREKLGMSLKGKC